MKLLMHVLKKNKELKIDNERINDLSIIRKLDEECSEVIEAIKIYNRDKTLRNLKEIVAETFDLIQVCILVIWKSHRRALTLDEPKLIEEVNIKHKDKLIEREWIIETGIEINIK